LIGLSPKLIKDALPTLIRLRDSGVNLLMIDQNVKAALAMF
jgi:ABC-type branched-subunit amino acid transport system ATPase component